MMPSISPYRFLCCVSSSSHVRGAVWHAPLPTLDWPRRGMGGPSRGVSGGVVQGLSSLPCVYYTPSAAVNLDHSVPQRTSGGHADQGTSRSTHARCRGHTLLAGQTGC